MGNQMAGLYRVGQPETVRSWAREVKGMGLGVPGILVTDRN